jgi:hypothetical protein
LLNGLEDVLTFIDKLIDSMGGMKGVLAAVSQLLLHSFSKQAADGIRNMVYNMKGFVGLNQKEAGETQDRAANLATQMTTLTTSNS